MKYRIFVLCLALCLPVAALASGTATFQANNEKSTMYWQDGMIRLSSSGQSGYMILRDDHLYVVTTGNGNTRVMDMTGVAKGFAQMAKNSSGEGSTTVPGITTQIESVTATGDTRTVAGIEGRVYKITTSEADGSTQIQTAVLTDNPLVVEMTAAYFDSATMLVGEEKAQHILDKLPKDDRGLLQAGNDFKLVSISATNPDDSLFKLPAKPTSVVDMIQKMLKKLEQSGVTQ